MMLNQYLKQSTYRGPVNELMAEGLAADFEQPWYTPLEASAQSTGIAVGGIGSSYTLTAAGTTPILNFIPGYHVETQAVDELRLEDFYFADALADHHQLLIRDFSKFQQRNKFFPLLSLSGSSLFDGAISDAELMESRVNEILSTEGLFAANQSLLQRWQVCFSPRTLKIQEQTGLSIKERNQAWLLEFFDGALSREQESTFALTCDWHANEYLGVPAAASQSVEYCALYPVARLTFPNGQGLVVERTHISPVAAGEEELAALPVSYTRIRISNPTQSARRYSLVRVLENLCGFEVIKSRPGVQDASFKLQRTARHQKATVFEEGASLRILQTALHATGTAFDGQVGLGVDVDPTAGCTLSAKPLFYSENQADVVATGLGVGHLSPDADTNIYSGKELTSSALCASGILQAGEQVEILFSLALDFSQINLPGLTSLKKYTEQFPVALNRPLALLDTAVESLAQLERALSKQIEFINDQPGLSRLASSNHEQQQMQTLAINTLSFLAEAAIWDKDDRFLVRECADYPFFNSLDVYFYGSFSLLASFPRLDAAVMRAFAEAILQEDPTLRRHHEHAFLPFADLPNDKTEGPRAVRGAVIHDLGSPFDARPDAYDWHNVKEWKDLAPKFVLMVLRQYRMGGDLKLVKDCWPAVQSAMQYLSAMVEPGQNFPLTRGTDDTFDNLASHGISVYCGSLWIAGLQAYAELSLLLDKPDLASAQRRLATKAKQQFQRVLWDETEGYYYFYQTPVQLQDISAGKMVALVACLQQVQILGGDHFSGHATDLVLAINQWLDQAPMLSQQQLDQLSSVWSTLFSDLPKHQQTKHQRRRLAKCYLLSLGDFWTEQFVAKQGLDSDDCFADQLIADTYCQLLGLEGISTSAQRVCVLKKVYHTNYKTNSPRVGAANLVTRQGGVKEWHNFQAHDVWIGVQYSLALAMLQNGLEQEARQLMLSTYENLYFSSKLPFSAPEGFNVSTRLQVSDLATISAEPQGLFQLLKQRQLVLEDDRVSPSLPEEFSEFLQCLGTVDADLDIDTLALYRRLHHSGLRYTAARYFRPGMIFGLVLNHEIQQKWKQTSFSNSKSSTGDCYAN